MYKRSLCLAAFGAALSAGNSFEFYGEIFWVLYIEILH